MLGPRPQAPDAPQSPASTRTSLFSMYGHHHPLFDDAPPLPSAPSAKAIASATVTATIRAATTLSQVRDAAYGSAPAVAHPFSVAKARAPPIRRYPDWPMSVASAYSFEDRYTSPRAPPSRPLPPNPRLYCDSARDADLPLPSPTVHAPLSRDRDDLSARSSQPARPSSTTKPKRAGSPEYDTRASFLRVLTPPSAPPALPTRAPQQDLVLPLWAPVSKQCPVSTSTKPRTWPRIGTIYRNVAPFTRAFLTNTAAIILAAGTRETLVVMPRTGSVWGSGRAEFGPWGCTKHTETTVVDCGTDMPSSQTTISTLYGAALVLSFLLAAFHTATVTLHVGLFYSLKLPWNYLSRETAPSSHDHSLIHSPLRPRNAESTVSTLFPTRPRFTPQRVPTPSRAKRSLPRTRRRYQAEVALRGPAERQQLGWLWWAWWAHRRSPLIHVCTVAMVATAMGALVASANLSTDMALEVQSLGDGRYPHVGPAVYLTVVSLLLVIEPLCCAVGYLVSLRSSWQTFIHPPESQFKPHPSRCARTRPSTPIIELLVESNRRPQHCPSIPDSRLSRGREAVSVPRPHRTPTLARASSFSGSLLPSGARTTSTVGYTPPPPRGRLLYTPTSTATDSTESAWAGAYASDSLLLPLLSALRRGASVSDFVLDAGVLCICPPPSTGQPFPSHLLVPPESIRRELLRRASVEDEVAEMADTEIYEQTLLATISGAFWWPTLLEDVREFVHGAKGEPRFRPEGRTQGSRI